jgi:sirohydrochlorin cobaltochelatase
MMSAVTNPALEAFRALIQDQLVWAQIIVRPCAGGYELRHVADRSRSGGELRVVPLSEVRRLVQFTSAGAFRPLKSAPDLPSGWRIKIGDATELLLVLDRLYPGSIADWHAAQSPNPPVTNYREFTDRQTGMYRITTKLSDTQAAQVISASCHNNLCLKRRLWCVPGLEPDAPSAKSAIPCLEPCAVLLEFARKAVRLEQDEKLNLAVKPAEDRR